MTITTANALFRYFETLYGLNQNLIALCGVDIFYHQGEQERRIDEVITAVPRLIPYVFNKKNANYEIAQTDGLMAFSDDIPFLSIDYESILQKYKGFLGKVKKVRNKLEHEMHGARVVGASSGTTSMFSVTYKVADDEMDLDAGELIAFTKDLNLLFSKIQELMIQSAREHEYTNYPYYWRLIRCKFSDFNKIFESNLLQIFGSVLLPF